MSNLQQHPGASLVEIARGTIERTLNMCVIAVGHDRWICMVKEEAMYSRNSKCLATWYGVTGWGESDVTNHHCLAGTGSSYVFVTATLKSGR